MSKSFLPSDFMERIVAWPGPDGPGYVNLHWKSPDRNGFRGRPFKDLTAFMDLAQRAAVNPATFQEVYFCLSTQKVTGKVVHKTPVAFRHSSQALAVKALWIDVDVKPEKGYATLDEALIAITAFVQAALLPAPSAIVYSGGGVHVYFISDKPLTPQEWEPLAHGLRAEIQRCGLKCDAGLTTDIARVLRVPGTYNRKIAGQARPVLLKWLGQSYDFATDPRIMRLATLAPARLVTAAVTRPTQAPFDLSGFPLGQMHPLLAGLDAGEGFNIKLRSDLPLKIDEVVKGCVHFQDCATTHGKLHSEPLWQLTLLAASFFEDGRRWGHYFSKGYPSYAHEETDQKYDQKLEQKAQGNLGWPSCDAFEAAGAKCKVCPYYKKLRSPLHLAERVSPPAPTPAPLPPDDLMLPPGYTTDEHGRICELVTKTLAGGATVEEPQPLFMSEIRNPVAQGGRRAFMFETSLDNGRWGKAVVIEADLATDQGMLKHLRNCGVKPFVRHQGKINHFMTSWMQRLDEAKARVQTVPFGWLRGNNDEPIGFAYGGGVFLADSTKQTAGYTDEQLQDFYMPRGLLQKWHDALKVVTSQKHPALEAIIALSFAAPLMVFTGKYNCIAHAWSPETGAHKSTSIHIGAAVWGSPKMTIESPMSSPKGVIHKLGEIKNLPVYWDEISDDAKLDQVRPMLGILTEGGGATLLTQARAFHKKDEWQTLTLVGANKSLTQNIMRNIHDTDAQLQRVFEFVVEDRGDTAQESDVSILINSLDYNYGQVGLRYAEVLGRDPKQIAAYVRDVLRRFETEVEHKSKERFRAAMAACIYAGAELANKHVGCDFNLPELWAFLKREYKTQRQMIADAEVVGGSMTNTMNAVSQFFKACVRNALWVQALPLSKPPAITYIAGPTRDRPDQVHVRLAISDRVIEVSRDRLIGYLKFIEHNGAAVVTGLKKHFGATEHDKVNLAAGAGVLGGREHVIRIPVPPGSPFESDLFKHGTIEERTAAGGGETLLTAAVTQATADLEKVRDAS